MLGCRQGSNATLVERDKTTAAPVTRKPHLQQYEDAQSSALSVPKSAKRGPEKASAGLPGKNNVNPRTGFDPFALCACPVFSPFPHPSESYKKKPFSLKRLRWRTAGNKTKQKGFQSRTTVGRLFRRTAAAKTRLPHTSNHDSKQDI